MNSSIIQKKKIMCITRGHFNDDKIEQNIVRFEVVGKTTNFGTFEFFYQLLHNDFNLFK